MAEKKKENEQFHQRHITQIEFFYLTNIFPKVSHEKKTPLSLFLNPSFSLCFGDGKKYDCISNKF